MGQNSVFTIRNVKGWSSGLANLLWAELKRWETKEWYFIAALWTGIIGLCVMQFIGEGDVTVGLVFLGFFGSMFPMINVIITLQDEVVGPRETGTLAWLLSKPVSRTSYILSKLLSNSLGVLVTMVLAPGFAVYLEYIVFRGILIPIGPFLAGLGILFLNLFFYLSLTLMLGTFFEERGAVIGIPLALGLGYTLIQSVPVINILHPMGMFFPTIEEPLFVSVILGKPITNIIPLVATVVFCIVFVTLALWKFNHEEF